VEIQLALIAFGTIGFLASFASGVGAGMLFVLFFVVGAAVVAWVLTALAKQQQDLLLGVSAQSAAEAVLASFSGVGWKQIDGPGMLNFLARGFGIGGYRAKRPVVSVDIEDRGDGSTVVSIWTSAWSSRMGMMALCDRVVSKKFWLARKLTELPGIGAPTPPYGGPATGTPPQGSVPPRPPSM